MIHSESRLLVLGIGNAQRGDDAVGIEVARRIAASPPPHTAVRIVFAEASAIMESWRGAQGVVAIDALQSGAPPGTIRRIDAVAESVPADFGGTSTHAFGLGQAVELARALGELPPRLVLFGIEGADFGHGAPLSPPVAGAVREAAARVRRELAEWAAARAAKP
ncbi:MAG: hydrogenase maturation protease [Planctomycetota bacterium]|nr:hydrogenase maturation protease [Planctomycetota bacterium]